MIHGMSRRHLVMDVPMGTMDGGRSVVLTLMTRMRGAPGGPRVLSSLGSEEQSLIKRS